MLFKADPYLHPMLGQTRPGKTHEVHPDDGPKSGITFCGLKTNKVPGQLLEDEAGKVDCQACIRVATQRRRWPPPGEIAWEFHPRDGEPRWKGYVWGRERYEVQQADWCCWDDGEGDSCDSIEEGKAICLKHFQRWGH
jgi:hypothetical protein